MKWIVGVILALLWVGTVSAQVQYTVSDSALPNDVLNVWRPDSVEAFSGIPEVYQRWWQEISDCAHLHGDLTRISWWRVIEKDSLAIGDARMAFRCPIVEWCDGWSNNKKGHHNIYLAYNLIYDERLVKHEMLHDLLGKKNLKSPPHHPLFQQCGVLQ